MTSPTNLRLYYDINLNKREGWILINDIWNLSNIYKIYKIRANIPLRFLIWNICKHSTDHLQTSTKHWARAQQEYFVKDWNERITFWRNMDKNIFKNSSFSRNSPKHLIIKSQRNSRYICLALFLELGISCISLLRFEWNKLPLKFLKSLCQDILLFKP